MALKFKQNRPLIYKPLDRSPPFVLFLFLCEIFTRIGTRSKHGGQSLNSMGWSIPVAKTVSTKSGYPHGKWLNVSGTIAPLKTSNFDATCVCPTGSMSVCILRHFIKQEAVQYLPLHVPCLFPIFPKELKMRKTAWLAISPHF